MTRLAIPAAMALVAALGSVGVAAGNEAHGFSTRATIKQVDADSYKGRVFSERDACVGHRKIELWKQFAGPNVFITSFKADANGRWHYDTAGSQFYVVATRKKLDANHVCREDRSRTV
jgi:hypothetical protein